MVAACKRGAAFTRGRLNSVSGLPAIYRTGDHSKAFSAATLLLTMTLLMLAFSAIAGESLLNVSRWQIRALSEWPALIEAGLPAGDRRERYTASPHPHALRCACSISTSLCAYSVFLKNLRS